METLWRLAESQKNRAECDWKRRRMPLMNMVASTVPVTPRIAESPARSCEVGIGQLFQPGVVPHLASALMQIFTSAPSFSGFHAFMKSPCIEDAMPDDSFRPLPPREL